MDEARNRAKNFSVRALAGAGRAEHEYRAVFSSVLVFKFHFLDFGERHHDFLDRSADRRFDVHFVRGDARDALNHEFAARGFSP